MKKSQSPGTFALITVLVVLGIAATFFASAWYFRLVPMETEWGDWGTWAGAVGTMAGFAVAIKTLRYDDQIRQESEADDRIAQMKRVAITSTKEVVPASAPWQAHQDAWTDDRAA